MHTSELGGPTEENLMRDYRHTVEICRRYIGAAKSALNGNGGYEIGDFRYFMDNVDVQLDFLRTVSRRMICNHGFGGLSTCFRCGIQRKGWF